jgi:NADH-quinone oxidoreductase subunit G
VCLDRERCILCDRCTRFANEVAGDPLIHFQTAATRPRSTRSPTTRSPATSAATPCRSARSARSPPRPTASRPARGTSSQVESPARAARSGCRIARQSKPQGDPAVPGRRRRSRQLGWRATEERFGFGAGNSDERSARRSRARGAPPASAWGEAPRPPRA